MTASVTENASPARQQRRPVVRRMGEPIAVALAIVAMAIAWSYPLFLAPGIQTVLPSSKASLLFESDQDASISGAGRNSDAILTADFGRLIDQRICHPTPRAAALSEHMIELGLLGVPGYALTGNPVLAYNLACLLMLVIAGTGAFLLLRHWTGRVGLSAVMALVFAFHPYRLDDIAHPYVAASHWLPWILFAFERLLDTGRVRFAVLLAVTASLHGLTGGYPLLAAVGILGCYGPARLVQRRRELDTARLGWLAAAVATAALCVGGVLWQYRLVWETWALTPVEDFWLVPWRWMLPGGRYGLGLGLLALAAFAFSSRRARSGPALGLLLGMLVCIAVAVGFGERDATTELHGAYHWLAERLPLFDIVRVPGAVRNGAIVGLVLLAGIGLDSLLSRIRAGRQRAVTAIAGAVLLAEIFVPVIAKHSYGTIQTTQLHEAAPDPAIIAAHRALREAGYEGPVVDLPFQFGALGIRRLSQQLVIAGFHNQPTPACYASRFPPSFHAVQRMVARIQTGDGLTELAASGFTNIVGQENPARIRPIDQALRAHSGASLVHTAAGVFAYHIEPPSQTHQNPGQLTPNPHLESARPPRQWILEVRNDASSTWVLPAPIEPAAGRLRWHAVTGGAPSEWREIRILLPLALAPGATDRIVVDLGDPLGGDDSYPELTLPDLDWNLTGAPPERSGPR